MSVYGSGGSGAGTSPGGSDTEIQYNNAGSFAGDSKLTYDSTNGSVTLGGATVTADSPVLNLSQTWNNGAVTFTGLKLDVTNTASSSDSILLKLQVGGVNQFTVNRTGGIVIGGNGPFGFDRLIRHPGVTLDYSGSDRLLFKSRAFSNAAAIDLTQLKIVTRTFGWAANISDSVVPDLALERDSADILAQRRSTQSQTFRCYGTYTDSSNYVRASLSADSTSTTLAAETAGTGADDVPLNLTAAGAGTVKVNSVAEVAVSSTVAGLPSSPTVGMISRVTDADTPSIGSTVTGSGSSPALVWYNGTNWTVIGV